MFTLFELKTIQISVCFTLSHKINHNGKKFTINLIKNFQFNFLLELFLFHQSVKEQQQKNFNRICNILRLLNSTFCFHLYFIRRSTICYYLKLVTSIVVIIYIFSIRWKKNHEKLDQFHFISG